MHEQGNIPESCASFKDLTEDGVRRVVIGPEGDWGKLLGGGAHSGAVHLKYDNYRETCISLSSSKEHDASVALSACLGEISLKEIN